MLLAFSKPFTHPTSADVFAPLFSQVPAPAAMQPESTANTGLFVALHSVEVQRPSAPHATCSPRTTCRRTTVNPGCIRLCSLAAACAVAAGAASPDELQQRGRIRRPSESIIDASTALGLEYRAPLCHQPAASWSALECPIHPRRVPRLLSSALSFWPRT